MKTNRLLLLAGASLVMAFPASALAATDSDDTVVNATIGSELSITVDPSVTLKQDPVANTGDLTPTKPVGNHVTTAVVSTSPDVDVTIRDDGSTTPGQLDRVTGTGPTSLAQALKYESAGNAALGASDITAGTAYTETLSGSDSAVGSGASNFENIVNFRQALNAGEDVVAGDTYSLTATVTATDAP